MFKEKLQELFKYEAGHMNQLAYFLDINSKIRVCPKELTDKLGILVDMSVKSNVFILNQINLNPMFKCECWKALKPPGNVYLIQTCKEFEMAKWNNLLSIYIRQV